MLLTNHNLTKQGAKKIKTKAKSKAKSKAREDVVDRELTFSCDGGDRARVGEVHA